MTRRLTFYAALLAAWQALHVWGPWPPYLLPGPLQVLESLIAGFADRTFLIGIWVSLRRLAIGYALSLVLGVALGLWVGRVRWAGDTVGSLLLGLQTLPSICWLPLAIIWFGLSEAAIQFVVIMGALLAIAIHTDDGVKNIPPIYIKAGRNMGARGAALLWRVLLPAALPSILSGMKLGWSFAWRSLMAAELLYVSMGLGQLLMMGRELNDMAQVVAVMMVIIALGLMVDHMIFGKLERGVRRRWGLLDAAGKARASQS
ncbi:MAG TPA: ABC transporter permease [Candidatus Polarisedimenticolia bacterium]|nr:ABC transporter permease [Candidatus Polarisedimenticolia bacterium]